MARPPGRDLSLSIITWREASATSISELVELERRAQADNAFYDDAPWGPENFSRPLPGKADLSLLLRAGGELVGFLVASGSAGRIHIHRLAVDPLHQRMGYGKFLLAKFLSSASGDISINCDPRNREALRLYERAGFRRTGSTPANKVHLTIDALVPTAALRVWYVFTEKGMESGHAAHLPGLVNQMSAISETSAIRYGNPSDLPAMRPTIAWARAFGRLVTRARRERVDVMFVRIHWKLAALLWLTGRIGGWKVALWSSGGTGYQANADLPFSERVVRVFHRFVLRHAVDAVVTGPPTVLADYSRRYRIPPDRLLLGSNDVGLSSWRAAAEVVPELSQDRMVQDWLSASCRVLYVHGLDPLRGADRLPELAAAIHRKSADARLLVIGDGPLKESLVSCGLSVAGRIPNRDVAWALAQSHCLVVPSRQEGFPRVLVEAMALGVPAVAFDVGGCADVMGKLAPHYIAPDGDTEQMAALALAAAAERERAGVMPDLTRRAAAFDTPVVASALIGTLRALCQSDHTAASWMATSLWYPTFPKENQR